MSASANLAVGASANLAVGASANLAVGASANLAVGARACLAAAGCLLLAACSTISPSPAPIGSSTPPPAVERAKPVQSAASTPPGRGAYDGNAQGRGAYDGNAQGRGAYYKDDGPGDNLPPDLARIPDAQPKPEPLHRWANRPYEVFGKTYTPFAGASSFRQRGRASWYGRRYHGQQTSSGEPYDMYGMTGAHPTLPIPSYARVTNLANGRSVVVRINDRGPFHPDRILDLSYTAAAKLGFVEAGSAEVELASVSASDTRIAALSNTASVAVAPATAPPAGVSARAPAAAPGASAQEPAAPAGVYLQLGAFSARDNAESFRVRVYRELAWLNEAVQIVPAGSAFRLHLGPFRSRNDAQPIADRIRAELNFSPIFVTR